MTHRSHASIFTFAALAGSALAGMLAGAAAAQTPLPLKICVIDDRSGLAADSGIESLNGMRMEIEPLNAKGGINRRKVELVTYGGKADPQLTATLASRCAEDDKGLMIIGGSPSAAAAMIPVAAQNAIPYYILSAAADNLTDNAVWHFRFGPRAAQEGFAVAEAFVQLGYKKVAIINNSTPFGTDGARSATKELEAKGIKIVTQQTYGAGATDVAPLTVTANLRLGFHRLASRPGGAALYRQRLDYVLGLFPILAERAAQRAGTMSGGEQQMLAIGRALMADPKVLLLDGPSLGLAPTVVGKIFEILATLRRQGLTILLVEQHADDAWQLADYGYVMAVGRVRAEGPGNALRGDPALRHSYLGKPSGPAAPG